MNLKKHISELKRRNVFKASVAYIVVAWIIIQVSSIALPAFDAPPIVLKIILFLMVIGFPINFVFAWAFELTPEGIKKTKEVHPKKSITQQTNSHFNKVIIISLSIALIFLLFNQFKNTLTNQTDNIDDDKKSIAVLAFTDLSPERDQEYFSDGISEELLNLLAKIPELRVISRTSSFSYKGKNETLEKIGEDLNVTHILEGSVRKSGKQLRITTQLIKVADGSHLWSETYDRRMEDIFKIQDEIAYAVTKQLKIRLLGDIVNNTEVDPDAYNFYLKGRYFWNKRTEEGLRKSISIFQQAIDLNPTYALAYAGLADAYNMLAVWQYLEPSEAIVNGQAAAQKALEIDETLAEAHAALGSYKFILDWDWPGAEKEFRRAIELNPNYASAHQWYAELLGIMGRYDEARIEINKALDLDPLSLIINGVSGDIYHWVGQDDEALDQELKTLAMDPAFIPTHYFLFKVYYRKGMMDEAFTHFMGYYPVYYNLTTDEKETLQIRFKNLGWSGVGRFMIKKLEAKSKYNYIDPSNLSFFYTMVEDHVRALDYLEKAYRFRTPNMIYIGTAVEFDDLSEESRFQALLKKMGLK